LDYSGKITLEDYSNRVTFGVTPADYFSELLWWITLRVTLGLL